MIDGRGNPTSAHRNAAWLRQRISGFPVDDPLDIERVDFAGEDLAGVEFELISQLLECTFDRANLRGIHAPAYIGDCSMVETRLDGAWLSKSELYRCDLRAASLSGTKLSRTAFMRSDLRGADLSGAEPVSRTHFYRCDLREARLIGLMLHSVSFTETSLSGIDLSMTSGSIFPEPINVGSPDSPRWLEGDEALRWLEGAGASDLSYIPLARP